MSSTHQLEAEIAAQREQLAGSVNALAARLDVKAQAAARQLVTAGAAVVVLVIVWAVWKGARS